ncbi:MAG: CPBP family intramembrane metalloprotease [Candidatus Lokiarchaeota archaeon]|nr:CPBP family intramembrane metalloprotease [Candidatus Lokiarchaeota archaeon]
MGVISYSPLFNILMLCGSFGPLVASFSLTYMERGIDGIKRIWHKGWHCDKKSYLYISLLLIPGLTLLSLLLASLPLGYNLLELLRFRKYGYIFTDILVTFLIGGPFQEEFGWRGYALDYLQSKWNALESSIILGGIWSLWHFPLFFIIDSPQSNQSFISFTISIIAVSVLFTWLHNNTDGSVLVAMSFHASINVSYLVFLPKISITSNLIFTIFLDVTIICIVFSYGQKKLKRLNRKDEIVQNLKILKE